MRYFVFVVYLFSLLSVPQGLSARKAYMIEWADTTGTEHADYNGGLAVDNEGNIYVTGYFADVYVNLLTVKYGSAGNIIRVDTFDNGENTYAAGVAVDSEGNLYIGGYYYDGVLWDYLTLKYDSSGNLIWQKTFANGSDNYASGIAVDADKNVYITGSFYDGLSSNYLTVKYDSTGNMVWVDTFDSGNNDYAHGIAIDGNGDIYIVGRIYNGSDDDYLTIKYDASGNVIWIDTFDTGSNEYARGVAVDRSGNIYVAGYLVNGSVYNSIILKYDSSGNIVWVDTLESTSGVRAYGVTTDSRGNIYTVNQLYNGSNRDYLLVMYDSSGNIIWADTFDTGRDDYVRGVAVDNDGCIYISGHFDNGGDIDYLTIKYRKYRDAGILRVASVDTVCINSTYLPSVWVKNSSYEDTLNLDVSAYIDSQNVHVYTDMKSVYNLHPDDSALIVFDPWNAMSSPLVLTLRFSIITSDDNPENDTISQPLYLRDLVPPVIDSAVAFDGTNAISGIDDDDYVIIYFSESTNRPAIDNSNINDVLALSGGHSWLDGFGGLGDCLWNPDGTQLLIHLTTNISLPTVEVGDTIYPDGTTIQDVNGNPCTSPVVLVGSFDPSGIDMNKDNKMFLNLFSVNGGEISILYYVREENPYTITIYGVDGRKVRRIKGNKSGIHRVRIRNLPPGIYFVRLWQKEEWINRKVMIAR